jgi:mono/diheme cytochrome c family protein
MWRVRNVASLWLLVGATIILSLDHKQSKRGIMRQLIFGRPAIRYTLALALVAVALGSAFSFTSSARQSRPVSDGVYSAAQATKGQELYKEQCAECHGNAMEGAIGPPLVGTDFLSSWSARPVLALVDKTQKTMPFNSPGSLTREQANDLVAYMLQVAKYPAGRAELTDATSPHVMLPTEQKASAPAASNSGGASLPLPEGNLAELMRAIAFPNSNVIFNLQVKDPGKEPKPDIAITPFDYVKWGATVYPGWLAVDQAAVALVESAPLLMTPGRKCQNGRLAPSEREDWKKYVADLINVSKTIRKTAQERNYDAFTPLAEQLNQTCANCHMVYRDKGGTEGSGGNRCQ